jgi:hypothetical protein
LSEREKQRDLRAVPLPLVISAQREHLRNVRHSGQLARYPAISKKRLDGASNLTSVHAVARQAETVMLEEHSDWFLTMEGHDVALHDAVRPATCDETSLQDERRHHCRRAQIRSGSGIRTDNGEESPP